MSNLRVVTAMMFLMLLAGCRVIIEVPDGGHVNLFNQGIACLGVARCLDIVPDSSYTNIYEAHARPGYVFVHWSPGEDHLFGGETSPTVKLDASLAKGNTLLQGVIQSDHTFFLKPVFALEGYDTAPKGTPVLFQIDCQECDQPARMSWSAPLRQDAKIGIIGGEWKEQDEFVLASFVLYANEYDYKVENLAALAASAEGVAKFEGLYEGQVLRKGSQVIFHLVSQVPQASLGKTHVEIRYSFDIAGTTARFDTILSVYVGDRCPSC